MSSAAEEFAVNIRSRCIQRVVKKGYILGGVFLAVIGGAVG